MKYNLVCANPFIISLFGMMFFTGFTLGSMFIPSLSDQYGRKWFFVTAILAQAFISGVILMLPGEDRFYVHIIIGLMFLQGICTSCRIIISAILQSDFSSAASNNAITTCWNIQDGLIFIWLTLYYKFIGNNWIYPHMFGIA